MRYAVAFTVALQNTRNVTFFAYREPLNKIEIFFPKKRKRENICVMAHKNTIRTSCTSLWRVMTRHMHAQRNRTPRRSSSQRRGKRKIFIVQGQMQKKINTTHLR